MTQFSKIYHASNVGSYDIDIFRCQFTQELSKEMVFDLLWECFKWHLFVDLFDLGGICDLYISVRRVRNQVQPNCESWVKMEPIQTLKDISNKISTMLQCLNESNVIFLTTATRIINNRAYEPRLMAEEHILQVEASSSSDADSDIEVD